MTECCSFRSHRSHPTALSIREPSERMYGQGWPPVRARSSPPAAPESSTPCHRASTPTSYAPLSRRCTGRSPSSPVSAARSRRRSISPERPVRTAPTDCSCCRRTWSTRIRTDWCGYVREVARAAGLPLIVYNRANARFSPRAAVEVAAIDQVVGFKDGVGDIETLARTVVAVRESLRESAKPFQFFNGLPTAEATVRRLPRHRRPAVLVRRLLLRPRDLAGLLQRGDHGRREARRRAAAGFFHPLVAPARQGARLRGIPGQGRRAAARPGRRTGAATADRPHAGSTSTNSPRSWSRTRTRKERLTMSAEKLRISAVTITPVAFRDPPLLNSVGVHEPYALRAIVEVRTDGGLTGLGETYADARHLERPAGRGGRDRRTGRLRHRGAAPARRRDHRPGRRCRPAPV